MGAQRYPRPYFDGTNGEFHAYEHDEPLPEVDHTHPGGEVEQHSHAQGDVPHAHRFGSAVGLSTQPHQDKT